MALTQLAILDTDTFLIQRPSELPDADSSSSAPVYKVSAKDVGVYASSKYSDDVLTIIDDLKVINELLVNHDGRIANNYASIVALDAKVTLNQQHIDDNRINIAYNKRHIEQIENRSAISMYYKSHDQNKTGPGLMLFKNSSNNIASEFSQVRKISYNYTDLDNNQLTGTNFFVGDTLEVTCKNITSNQLTHRAAFRITGTEFLTDAFRFSVQYLGSIGTGLPHYDDIQDNPVRTDIYPNFSITEEVFETTLKDYLLHDGSRAMTGELTIKTAKPGIVLKNASSATAFKFNKPLTFSYLTGDSTLTGVLRLNQDGIDALQNITMGGTGGDRKRIYNLPEPQTDTEPATKLYVDGKFGEIEKDLDIYQFAPGDPVATKTGAAKSMGFYWDGGQLYFQT